MLDSPIDEIKSKISIVELLSEYIQLKPAGGNYKALCPFHREKTPSLMVSPERQIWKCFGCFPPGTMIKTKQGMKSVEEIRRGELVMTHKGRYCRVIRSLYRQYNENVVEISLRKLNERITLTSDHKVFVVRTKNCRHRSRETRLCQSRCQKSCPTKYFLDYKIEKMRADEISKNDYLLYPIEESIKDIKYIDLSKYLNRKKYKVGTKIKKIPLKLRLDKNLLKLIGYWIAEGSNHRAYIRFSLGSHELNFAREIENLIKETFGLKVGIHQRKGKKTGIEVTCCHSQLANIFENLLGKGAQNKHLPWEFIYLPQLKQRILIEAILKGDGYIGKKTKKGRAGRKHIGTISPLLTAQLKDILLRLKFYPSVNVFSAFVDKKGVRHRKNWDINWFEDYQAYYYDFLRHKEVLYWLLPVREINKKKYNGTVYNLTVAKDHSYVANNFSVGNCGEGGDIFGFVMKMEGLEFPEALRLLAGKAGVVLRQQDPRLSSQKNKLLEIVNLAAKYYHKVLLDSSLAQRAKDYLIEERGLTEETLEDFLLGFAPDSWDTIINFLKKKGYTDEEIFLAGLSVKKEKEVGYYDRFRGRIMYPINDLHGQPVGFTARILNPQPFDSAQGSGPSDQVAKYVNTPQTLIYDKSSVLYGLDKAKLEIKKQKYTILVEGNMDAVALHQAGIKNVVAVSGTSLTLGQIQLLKRYSPNVILAFDADAAGQGASFRGVELALAQGLNIKIIELPKDAKGEPLYKDPDECVKKDQQAFLKALKEAHSILDYYFRAVLDQADLEKVEEKKKAAKILTEIIAKVFNPVEQNHYLNKLAQILDTPEAILREIVAKAARTKAAASQPEEISVSGTTKERPVVLAEKLLGLIIKYPNLAERVFNELPLEMIPDKDLAYLYKELIIYYTKTINQTKESWSDLDYKKFKENLSLERREKLDDLVLAVEKDFYSAADQATADGDVNLADDEIKTEISQAIKFLKTDFISQALKKITQAMAQAEQANDHEAVQKLTEEFNLLTQELRALNS